MTRQLRTLGGAICIVGPLVLLGLVTIIGACRAPGPATVPSFGLFEGTLDVGSTTLAGSAVWDDSTDSYTITGSGENMWGERDAFRMVWKRVGGDFMLSARASLGNPGDPGRHEHRKFGLIVRSGLGEADAYADAAVHADGLASLQFRRAPGAVTEEVPAPGFESGTSVADVVQLERSGGSIVASFARFGEALTSVRLDSLALGDSVYVGLFVCAHDSTALETATFSQVRLSRPAAPDFTPYRDYIGSRLEILDVETGDRRVVFTDLGSIQAPNWTTDGKALIFNRNGLLYRFDLATGDTTRIDTGFATENNNDHVLSFDGSTLAISHHADDADGQSIIYTVPVTGGVPKRVTEFGPSYLHGWSPDAKHLVYTALRGDDYDVYRIPVEGGAEVRLTDAKGLDDGPEYTPGGEWIWFNSLRSGTMQLWRMRPDGSGAQRMTQSGTNDWFPHVSPDSKRVVFLAFGPEVPPADHPFYRHVTLQLMPADGSTPPRTVAYVYGGQGTINVPSWSPDSRQVAFVSNTGAF